MNQVTARLLMAAEVAPWKLAAKGDVDVRLPAVTTHHESCGRDLWNRALKNGTIMAELQIISRFFSAVQGRMVICSISVNIFLRLQNSSNMGNLKEKAYMKHQL